jgi:hypothetical protein
MSADHPMRDVERDPHLTIDGENVKVSVMRD